MESCDQLNYLKNTNILKKQIFKYCFSGLLVRKQTNLNIIYSIVPALNYTIYNSSDLYNGHGYYGEHQLGAFFFTQHTHNPQLVVMSFELYHHHILTIRAITV